MINVILSIFFIFNLFRSRKNLFALIFLLITFIFLYGRYLIVDIDSNFIIGGQEWIFPGVSYQAVLDYQIYFFIFFVILSLGFIALKEPKKLNIKELHPNNFVKFLIAIVGIFGAYRGYLYTDLVINNGYIAAVDYRPPFFLSLVTSSFLKPFAISFALLYIKTSNKLWRNLFISYTFLIALTWQRSDLIGVLLIYICLYFTYTSKKFYITKLFFGVIAIVFLGYIIFYIREGGDWNSGDNIFLSILWGLGISSNPGLFIIDNPDSFAPLDSLGFPVTYVVCGVGKIFSGICNTDERLLLPGFLLEKITSAIGVFADGSFIGLGGNIVGSLYVASNMSNILFINLSIFIILSILVTSIIVFLFNNATNSVIGCLLLGCIFISSRSSFDGIFPPLQQIIVALIIDKILKNRGEVLSGSDN